MICVQETQLRSVVVSSCTHPVFGRLFLLYQCFPAALAPVQQDSRGDGQKANKPCWCAGFMLSSDAILNIDTLSELLASGHSRVPVHVPGNRFV